MKLRVIPVSSALLFFSLSAWSLSSYSTECRESLVSTFSPMEYVTICRSPDDCRRFSRLVMGTDHLVQGDWVRDGQAEQNEAETFRVLDEAAKHGINFFDTSPIYVGGVENRLGKWKKSRSAHVLNDDFFYGQTDKQNPDRKLYTLSKGGFPFDLFWAQKLEPGTHSEELKSELVKRGIMLSRQGSTSGDSTSLENVPPGTYASRLFGDVDQIRKRVGEEMAHTLSNLDGDIAVYLMHRDDGDAVEFAAIERTQTPVSTIMEALSERGLSDRFWMLGWSNWKTARVNESVRLAQTNPGLARPMLNSPYFSLFEMSSRSIHALGEQVTHAEMMDPNFQPGIKIMPYSPLGGFSILDKPEPAWENARKAAYGKYRQGDPYWRNVYPAIFTKENEARYYRVVDFTKNFNRNHKTQYTVDQMINAYALAHPRTDFLAIGAISVEQVRRTVQALELSKLLTSADLDYLHSGSIKK